MSSEDLFTQTDGLRSFSQTHADVVAGLSGLIGSQVTAAGVEATHGTIASSVYAALTGALKARQDARLTAHASTGAAPTPYQRPMVGESAGTRGFEPLDPIGTSMQNTRSLFAVIGTDSTAGQLFTNAARQRAATYQRNFASLAAADSKPANTDQPRRPECCGTATRLDSGGRDSIGKFRQTALRG